MEPVDCRHATNLGTGVVYCHLGEAGGRPSAGHCLRRCQKREPMPEGQAPRVSPPVQVTVSAKGGTLAGTLVRSILSRMGIKAGGDCGCAEMERKMNEWGPIRCCTIHLPELVTWFAAKASEQRIDVTPALLLSALMAAWKEARGE